MKKTRFTLLSTSLLVALALTGCSSQPSSDPHAGHTNTTPAGQDAHAGHNTQTPEAVASGKVKPVWQFSEEHVEAKQPAELRFQLLDPADKPITDYEIVHEKKLHLIVVSEDLSYFDHVHPESQAQGWFSQKLTLPSAGRYKLIADVAPKGLSANSYGQWVEVHGEQTAAKPIVADTNLTQTVAGQQVTLKFDSEPQKGKAVQMTFAFEDAATHQPTTDLETYLGAVGHVVAMSADAEQYLHVHPLDEKGHGPTAAFHIEFPESGLYKIWGQFQRKGDVFIAPFVIKVP